MAWISPDEAQVNARILYWGVEGAGKLTSLAVVQAKLRADHRGVMREVPTRLDPSVNYTVLPITLGEIAGMQTQIELVCVPGASEQAPTRKQLLDEVDGVVLVVDSQADRVEENADMLDELRKGLADYARSFEDLPLVVQYNKRDLSDDYVIDELHRRLELGNATVFESVAVEGTGVLQTLSTISKKVIRTLRGESLEGARPADEAKPTVAEITSPDVDGGYDEPESAPLEDPPMLASDALEPLEGEVPGPELEVSSQDLEEAILSEGEALDEGASLLQADVSDAQNLLEPPWHHGVDALEPPTGARIEQGLTIVSVGEATRADERTVRVPLVLGDADGETSTLVLSVRLDPLLDESD
jgi:signal recognition particle receptor subunit beta